jgi:hypothetical protein
MHSVESLLRRCRPVGRERDTEKEQAEGADKGEEKSGESRKKRRGINEAACIQSKEACYEAAIQSETNQRCHRKRKSKQKRDQERAR